MSQEDKQLLLKDLCARLPYGVIVQFEGWNPEKLSEVDLNTNVYNGMGGLPLPYLRPISSMTEKEKKERDFYCGYKPYDENTGESYLTEYDMPDYLDFLYEHHLDFRGLIPKGLALKAKDGMYKTE